MSTPDLSTLPKRIRYAAAVLTEVRNHAVELHHADEHFTRYSWDVSSLLKCAEVWEERADREQAEREALIEHLVADLHEAIGDRWPLATMEPKALHSYRQTARNLLESGWRKGGPA